MLRRVSVVLALCLAFALAGHAAGQAEPHTGERILLSPADGTLQTRFSFTGSGFLPGRLVSVRVVPPGGLQRRLLSDDQIEQVWQVGADGRFVVEFVPAARFPEARAGRWQMLFCADTSPNCQLVEFDVLP